MTTANTIVQKVRLELETGNLEQLERDIEGALGRALQRAGNKMLHNALAEADKKAGEDQPAIPPAEAPEPGPAKPQEAPSRRYGGPDVQKPAAVPVTK